MIRDNSFHPVHGGRADKAPSGASQCCCLINRRVTVERFRAVLCSEGQPSGSAGEDAVFGVC